MPWVRGTIRVGKFAFGAAVIVSAGLVGYAMTGAALDRAETPVEARGSDEAAPLAVETAAVEEAAFADEVRAVGTTQSIRHVDIYPLSEGRVTQVLFESGDAVAEGELLLRLDDGAERAALKAAEATRAEAEAAASRQLQLAGSAASSPALVQAAEAALLRAEAEVQEAAHLLSQRTLNAPFSGVVGLTDIEVGSRVDTTTLLTTLDDLSAVEVAFSVPERYLARLRPGLPVELSTAAHPDRTFEGRVVLIDTRVDQETRSVALRAVVPNEGRELRGGMFMDVALVLGERRAPAVPERGLVAEGETTHVFVVNEGVAERREVVTGATRDGVAEIVDGLAAGERVVVSDLQSIADGRAVTTRAAPDTITVGSAR